MHDFTKLELSTETLRELSPDELSAVAGGVPPQPTPPVYAIQTTTWVIPSGATWFRSCESAINTCA